jgi:Xaa-Pro aminopeptidase
MSFELTVGQRNFSKLYAMANQFFFDSEIYVKRRKQLMNELGKGQVFLLGNKNSSISYEDDHYPFRQDSTFLYYIGINLPDLAAIIDVDAGQTTVFGLDASVEMVVWTGDQPTMRELADKSGIKNIQSPDKLRESLRKDFQYLPPYRPEHTLFMRSLTRRKHSERLVKAIVKQREIKGEEEIEQIDIAHTLSAKMQRLVMETARPGMFEHELVGVASKFCWDHGVKWGYNPILTINGQTLHNHYYGNKIEEGQLLLYDGGVEAKSGYQGDLTRTFPVGKKFTALQADIYRIVHRGYLAAVEASKPDATYRSIHLHVAKVMFDGLKDVGWTKGNTEDAVAAGAHALFFPHGLGHMIGLDVHDMENFGESLVGYTPKLKKAKEFGLKSLRLGKTLKKGFVLTIEPGIYVIPKLVNQFQNQGRFGEFIHFDKVNNNQGFGGVRIEDDYLLTENGCRVLGEPFPATLEDVEQIRSI